MGNPAIPKRLKNKVLSLQRKDQRNSKKQTGFPQKGNALWKTRADLSGNRGKRDEPDGGDESPPYRGSGEKFPVPQFSGSGAKDAVPPIRPGLEFLRLVLCKGHCVAVFRLRRERCRAAHRTRFGVSSVPSLQRRNKNQGRWCSLADQDSTCRRNTAVARSMAGSTVQSSRWV